MNWQNHRSMLNPYQPPPEVPKSPLWIRFRRACSMAMAEYHAGLQRDGFTRRQHVGAWVGMFAAAFVVLALLFWIIIMILIQLGVV